MRAVVCRLDKAPPEMVQMHQIYLDSMQGAKNDKVIRRLNELNELITAKRSDMEAQLSEIKSAEDELEQMITGCDDPALKKRYEALVDEA